MWLLPRTLIAVFAYYYCYYDLCVNYSDFCVVRCFSYAFEVEWIVIFFAVFRLVSSVVCTPVWKEYIDGIPTGDGCVAVFTCAQV